MFVSEVNRALHQFVFECMRLTSVDDAGAIDTLPEPERQLDIPWDDPYPFYVGMMLTDPPDDDPLRCEPESDDVGNDALSQLSPDIKAGRSLATTAVAAGKLSSIEDRRPTDRVSTETLILTLISDLDL